MLQPNFLLALALPRFGQFCLNQIETCHVCTFPDRQDQPVDPKPLLQLIQLSTLISNLQALLFQFFLSLNLKLFLFDLKNLSLFPLHFY